MAKTTSILSLAGAALAFSIAGASAADLPYKAPMMAPAAPAFDWSGWYAGVGLGGSWNDFDWVYPNGATPASQVSRDEARVGFHGGAQYQLGNMGFSGLVVGYEYSGSYSMDGMGNGSVACPNAAFTCQAKLESLYTIGGKLGLTWDRFMLYGTGGWAGGNVQTQADNGVVFERTKQWHNGWFIGGGLDYAFYHSAGTDWILGVDYKHVELDSVYHGLSNIPAAAADRTITPTSDILMARLTVKFQGPSLPFGFGGSAPVAARY